MKIHLKRGFTLFELLIVIAIISILISIVVVSYSTVQKKSRDSRRKSDMKAVQNALEQYYADNSSAYPDGTCADLSSTYLPAGFPVDPVPDNPYTITTCSPTAYCICATLAASSGNSSDVNCSYLSNNQGAYFCISQLQ